MEFTNTSGEDQDVWAGSFGDIGPEGPTYYYNITPEHVQDHVIAGVLKNQFFRMSRSSTFDKTSLRAGDSARAKLQFDVRDGVTNLGEIQLAVRHEVGRIHVLL